MSMQGSIVSSVPMMIRWLLVLLVGLALGTAALAEPADPASGGDPKGTVADAASPDYMLGVGDKIRIIVFGEDALTGSFSVPVSGRISFPLIGDVQAGGLSVGEVQNEITTKLKDGYLKDPRVSIEVMNYRPFYILGEVAKPGEYPFTNGLTVLKAVATANGFTYRADKRRVYIKRSSDAKEVEYPLNSPIVLQPGDTIRIAERFF